MCSFATGGNSLDSLLRYGITAATSFNCHGSLIGTVSGCAADVLDRSQHRPDCCSEEWEADRIGTTESVGNWRQASSSDESGYAPKSVRSDPATAQKRSAAVASSDLATPLRRITRHHVTKYCRNPIANSGYYGQLENFVEPSVQEFESRCSRQGDLTGAGRQRARCDNTR